MVEDDPEIDTEVRISHEQSMVYAPETIAEWSTFVR